MRIAGFDEDTSYKIRLAFAFFDMEPSEYIRRLLGREFITLAKSNELLRIAFKNAALTLFLGMPKERAA
jgi:hypothetical protein